MTLTGAGGGGRDRGMMVLRDESDEAALRNIAAAQDRAARKVPGRLHDVLVMGAGLHDNAFGADLRLQVNSRTHVPIE